MADSEQQTGTDPDRKDEDTIRRAIRNRDIDDLDPDRVAGWLETREKELEKLEEQLRKQEYDFTTVMEMANQIIARSVNTFGLEDFINYIKTTFQGHFGVKDVYIVYQQHIQKERLQLQGKGDVQFEVDRGNPFIMYLKKKSEPVSRQQLESELGTTEEVQKIESLDVELLMPLSRNVSSIGVELQGILMLGPKILDDEYSDSEKQFLALLGRMIAISLHNANLHQKSITDSLTGLFTRGHFDLRLQDRINQVRKEDTPEPQQLSVVMMDIDHFKEFNDKYGHQVGDEVLKTVSRTLQENTRDSDLVARYGGEEFVVVAPDTDLKHGYLVADRLRKQVEKKKIEDQQDRELSVTISAGVSTFPDHGTHPQELISAADRALYQAKDQGRNRVIRAGS